MSTPYELVFDNKYCFVKDLGVGSFGKVFLAKDRISDKAVAIKCLKEDSPERQKDIIHEIRIIAQINHPNIGSYRGSRLHSSQSIT